jgi:N-acetylmuramoyl-L-alanine amidase
MISLIFKNQHIIYKNSNINNTSKKFFLINFTKRLLLIFIILCFCNITEALKHNFSNKLKTVVIDPGHGGKDYGAIGKTGREKDIVLSISLKLGSYIEKEYPDVKVIYTRKTDVFVPLIERAEIANKNNADLFISVHVNANPSSVPYGVETYAMGLHKSKENLEVAKLENASIFYEEDYNKTYDGFDPNSAESYIIFTLLQNAFLEQSINFASYIQSEFKEKAKRYDRGVKQAGFLVLWKTSMPSILVETGFISNPKEEKFLVSEEGQEQLAFSIFNGFKAYKSWFDNHNYVADNDFIPSKVDTPKSDTVYYKVQISSSKKPLPTTDKFFKGRNDIEMFEYDGIYRYTVGTVTSFDEIVAIKTKIIKDFPDAFIIAVKNGKIVPLKEVINQEIKK